MYFNLNIVYATKKHIIILIRHPGERIRNEDAVRGRKLLRQHHAHRSQFHHVQLLLRTVLQLLREDLPHEQEACRQGKYFILDLWFIQIMSPAPGYFRENTKNRGKIDQSHNKNTRKILAVVHGIQYE